MRARTPLPGTGEVLPYVKTKEVYLCPTNPTAWALAEKPYGWGDYWTDGTYAKGEFTVSYGLNTALDRNNSWQPFPLSISDFPDPASVIALGESRIQNAVTPWFSLMGNHAPLPELAGEGSIHYHLKRTNYIFLDGHFRSLRAIQTLQPRQQWGPFDFAVYDDDGYINFYKPNPIVPPIHEIIREMAPEYK